jgi:hypothetical protein
VPTRLRTIWWQKALAEISNRSTPSPRSDQPGPVDVAAASEAWRRRGAWVRRQKAENVVLAHQRVAGQAEQVDVERLVDVPSQVGPETGRAPAGSRSCSG